MLVRIKYRHVILLFSAEYRNNFVRVQVISGSASINCTFLSVEASAPISCNATITYGDDCQERMVLYGTRESNKDFLVAINLRKFLEETVSSKYCEFRVSATANTRMVTVDGNILGKLAH